jgi:hypothetical protein
MLTFGISHYHWWPHYANLFSWYIVLIVIYSCAVALRFLKSKIDSSIFHKKILTLFSIFIWVVVFVKGFSLLGPSGLSSSTVHRQEEQALIINDYLYKNYNDRPSFLSPYNMYLHWVLDESRHGFPQAANTQHIESDWWIDLPNTKYFLSPKSLKEYCYEIKDSSIDIIFVDFNTPIDDCIRQTFRDYFIEGNIYQANSFGTNYWIRRN